MQSKAYKGDDELSQNMLSIRQKRQNKVYIAYVSVKYKHRVWYRGLTLGTFYEVRSTGVSGGPEL